nr:tRNA lysidine(34) synthetase TilS [Sulfitobacter albidus]
MPDLCLHVATVDHGLRAQSRQEAAAVAKLCADWDLPHTTLRWTGWDGAGNLQDAARRARYALLAEWAQGRGIEAVALGHTQDDQAETVLMQLARHAGADGLSGMGRETDKHGVRFLRPCLELRRADLRRHLGEHGIGWAEDPSNDNPEFARIRMRQALPALADAGLDAAALAGLATRMQGVCAALDYTLADALEGRVETLAGALCIPTVAVAALPDALAHRFWRRAIRWVSGGAYGVRQAPLERFAATARAGGKTTLGGCVVESVAQNLWLYREAAAVTDHRAEATGVWDGCWHLDGTAPAGSYIAAMGFNGLKKIHNYRDFGLPRDMCAGLPALWHEGEALHVPVLYAASQSTARLIRRPGIFKLTGL